MMTTFLRYCYIITRESVQIFDRDGPKILPKGGRAILNF